MPIYNYRLKTGDVIEVFQKASDPAYTMLGEIDPETILTPGIQAYDAIDATPVERVPSTPGAFIGLPTPKFHR